MPSAKRRNFNRGPVSREVYDRHNKHSRETWPEIKRRQDREQRAKEPRYVFGDRSLGEY